MPRVPTDYSKTCIYKLVHKDDVNNENIYIGSTTNFRKRKNEHKSRINKESNDNYNQLKYVYIRENGGWDMWDMIEIEKYPCNDKREAETRERHWIDFYKSKLNSSIPTRTIHEWYLENKETHSINCKLYNENNKELISKKKKQHHENNKELISKQNKEYVLNHMEETKIYQKKYRTENTNQLKDNKKKYYQENYDNISEKSKQHYKNNRDKILKQIKEYVDKNLDKIKARQKEKMTCECGCVVNKYNIQNHKRTVKHQQSMENLN